MLDATGYEATLLSQPRGRRMLGNVRRVLELAREGQAGKVSLSQFIAQMGERVVDQSRFEQAAVAGECEDVVRLMTIHKAKGLQFGAVFVPDLSASRHICNDDLINRVDWGLVYKHHTRQEPEDEQLDPPAKDAQAVSYRLARDLEDRDQQAEDIRKLYVAATRHKDHLVFVAADWRDSKGRFTSGKGPSFYINRIDDALDIRGAIDAGRGQIAYAEGKFTTTVRIIRTAEAPQARRATSRGEKLLAVAESPADFVRGVVKSAGRAGPPALIGPVPTSAGRVEIAVTGLNDFVHCPMLYHWAHELRIPEQMCQSNGEGGGETPSKHGLDAATLGTLLHRCMELLDFDRPQSSQGLLDQAASEMELQEQIDTSRLASELDEML
ncbi:MAG: PD-(D/E)XK nuclease family protein, partial [Phycisphaerae bacterium]|nr:PD-(D/E)XK nuclease family protein [Phycisphaerae bacterium]